MPQPQSNTRTNQTPLRVLRVDSSSRYEGSLTRNLTDELLAALRQHGELSVTTRDLALGLPFIDEAWIAANFTAADARTTEQQSQLAYSDHLVRELQEADVIVIGAPIYNFSVPATLKAWIDMVARARLTFRYTEHGPQGLLRGKKAFLVVASGGVAVDDAADFATPYLRHMLAFLGISDVEIIAATQANSSQDQALLKAREAIAEISGVSHLVHTAQAA